MNHYFSIDTVSILVQICSPMARIDGEPSMALAPGQMLAHDHLAEQIGEGGTVVVWEGGGGSDKLERSITACKAADIPYSWGQVGTIS